MLCLYSIRRVRIYTNNKRLPDTSQVAFCHKNNNNLFYTLNNT